MLSVVVPAYNEEDRIGPTLDRIAGYLCGRREDHEIIVVDDGSSDATAGIVASAAKRWSTVRLLPLPRNLGKGAAVRTGILASRGDEVLFSDADLATPIEELEKLRVHLHGGCDIAIGSRASGADIRVRQHPVRELMGRTFNRLVRMLVMNGIRDTQCGFKLFRGDVARELFARGRVNGFAFDVEILLLARSRYRIAEVPVVWSHVEQSKVSPGRDAARMLVDLVGLKLSSWSRRSRGISSAGNHGGTSEP